MKYLKTQKMINFNLDLCNDYKVRTSYLMNLAFVHIMWMILGSKNR